MNSISNLNAYFVVSNELPLIGVPFECSIIDIIGGKYVSLLDTTLIPTNVTIIDNNMIKLKTCEHNKTYIVMYPNLNGNGIILGKINEIPYLDGDFICHTFNFELTNNHTYTINCKEVKVEDVKRVKKCAKDTYLVYTLEDMYIVHKA